MNPSPSLHVPTAPPPSNDLPDARRIRTLGWLLIVLGPCISATMACAARAMYGTVAFDRLTGRPPHWHGSPEFTRTALELFGAVFLLGIVILLGGIHQVRTGRRSRVLIVLTLGLAGATAYLVFGIASSR